MSKTSIFLIIIFLLTLITLLTVNTLYSPQPVLNSLPAIFPTKSVVASENSLSLNPSVLVASAGKPATILVVIDSKGELPSVIQMELAYDPNVLAAVTLTPGTFFSTPQVLLNNINAKNGRISYAIAPSADQTTATGSNIVATIQVIPRLNAYKQATTLNFLPKTIVKTKTSQNTVILTNGTTISVAPYASSSGRVVNY
jgi:hypothetical protein